MMLSFELETIPEQDMPIDIKVDASHFNQEEGEGSLSHDVVLKGSMRKWEHDVFLSGEITANWTGDCVRCLEPINTPISTNITAKFVPESDSPEPGSETELSESDIDVEYYRENKINLSQPIYDQIMLSLPSVNLCEENCKGLCSQCGVNLNTGKCSCDELDNIDPRLAVLKNLKNKIK
jgi:uncharacterized protein